MKSIGRYEVQAELGRGGFGQVFRAYDPRVGRAVAIKVLQAAEEPELIVRFRSEAAAAGKLRHRNIITIYDFGEQDHVPYLVMEYLEGEDLEHVISGRRPLTLLQKLDIMAQTASGLHHAHVHGIVHRDIKPANLMLLGDGTVKIMDFGIALLSQATAARITPQGSLVGTFPYMSPEQFYGAVSDPLTDLFAYGVTAYKLLTGVHPFHASEMAAMMHNIMSKTPAPLRSLVPQCPEALEDAVSKMLAKEREARYQSLEDVRFDLEPIIGELRKERIGELVTEARGLMESGDFDRAQALMREVLEIDAGNRTARDLREQLQRLIRERAVRPQIEALLDAGRQELQAQHYDEAIKKFESALRLDKSNHEIQELIQHARADWEQQQHADRLVAEARHSLDAGELTAANKGISDALAASPEHLKAKALRAEIREKLEARQREALLRDGLSRARGLMVLQSFDAAVGFLTHLQNDFPESSDLARLLAEATLERDAKIRQERLRTGIEEVKDLIKKRQFSEASSLAGRLAIEFRDSKELVDLGSYAAEEERAEKRALVVAQVTAETSSLVEAGHFDEAIRRVKSALEDHPTASTLRELLLSVTSAKSERARREALARTRAEATELIGKGSYARALDCITAFTTAYGESAELDRLRRSAEEELQKKRRIAEIRKLVLQAQGLIDEGRPDSASEMLQEATVQFPEDSAVTRLLGEAQDQLREQRRAQDISRLISEAESLARLQQFEASLKVLDEALQRYPSDGRLSRCKEAVAAGKRDYDRQRIRLEVKDRIKALQASGALVAALQVLDATDPHIVAEDREFGRLRSQLESDLQQKQREEKLQQTVAQAEALISQGDFLSATNIISEASKTFPSNADLDRLLRVADERRREQGRANEIAALVRESQERRNSGQLDAAEKVLRAALSKYPGEAALQAEVRILREAKEARDHQQAIARTCAQARELLDRGEAAAASTLLRQAVQDNPGQREITDLLTTAERLLADREDKQAVADAVERASGLARASRFAEALACVDAALERIPSDPSLLALRQEIQSRNLLAGALSQAEDLRVAREFAAALRVIDDALRTFPHERLLLEARTRIQGEIEAKERTDTITRIVEEGRSLLDAKRYTDAVSRLRQASSRFPDADAIADLLRRAERESREEQSRRENERIGFEAEGLIKTGRSEKAIEILEKAGSSTPQIRELLSQARAALNQRRREESFREALKLCEQGRYEEALAGLQHGVLQYGSSSEAGDLRERLERELDQQRRREARDRDLSTLLELQRELASGPGKRRVKRAQEEISGFATLHAGDAEIADLCSQLERQANAVLARKPGKWKLPLFAAGAAIAIAAAGLLLAPRLLNKKNEPVPVEVRTDPQGASVTIGNRSCVTPNCRFDIQPGEYALHASLEGYRPLERSVTVYTGRERHYIELTLEPVPPAPVAAAGTGTLTVKTGQPRTLVFVDNTAQKRTDASGSTTLELPIGMHSVRVAKPGFQAPGEQRIAITAREAGVLAFNLIPQAPPADTAQNVRAGTITSPPPVPPPVSSSVPELTPEAAEAQDWRRAHSSADVGQLRDFLARHPQSSHASEAEAQIDDLDWLQTNTSDTRSLGAYLSAHSNGRHAREATMKVAELDWMNLPKGDEDKLRAYIAAHPNSTYRTQAEGLIADIDARKAAADQAKNQPPAKERLSPQSQSEAFGIDSALAQFNQAFQRKQPRDVKRIWPSVPTDYTDAMRLSGASFLMYLHPLEAAEVNGETASIRCDLLITRTLRGKADQTHKSVKVRLQKVNGSWSILDPLGS